MHIFTANNDVKGTIMMGVDIKATLNIAGSNRQADANTAPVQPAIDTAIHVNTVQKNVVNVEAAAKVAVPQKQTIKIEQDNIMASFEYDQHLKQVIITLKNTNTGEVVQQFPSEKVLRILEGIMQTMQPVITVNSVDAKG